MEAQGSPRAVLGTCEEVGAGFSACPEYVRRSLASAKASRRPRAYSPSGSVSQRLGEGLSSIPYGSPSAPTAVRPPLGVPDRFR